MSEPYYSQRARSVCVALSAFFISDVFADIIEATDVLYADAVYAGHFSQFYEQSYHHFTAKHGTLCAALIPFVRLSIHPTITLLNSVKTAKYTVSRRGSQNYYYYFLFVFFLSRVTMQCMQSAILF